MNETHAILIYFTLIFGIAIASYSKKTDVADFFVGSRSMNYWLTALSAHASDMSSWLFMAFPATIFTCGLFKAWVAVGLLLFMYLNWQFVAPKIRIATENSNSFTFFSYLENKFKDKNLILYCSLICIFFYSVYIASGLMGMGLLIEEIYGFKYESALLSGTFFILICVILGGYRTLAWIDLFQGCFLLFALMIVPFYIVAKMGGWHLFSHLIAQKNVSLSLLPKKEAATFFQIAIMIFGWGLGYFGQPAIITKFMGIKRTSEIKQAKRIGMIWMFLSLTAATLVGIVAVIFFKTKVPNPEMIFIDMVQATFHPFIAGFILCAIFAATINVISSQMLVIGSSFFENIYQRFSRASLTSQNSLFITKMSMCIISALAFAIAYFKISSIYYLVLYAWSGLGSAFGPVLLFSLYSKNNNRNIGWVAVLVGSISSSVWPWVDMNLGTGIDPVLVGFSLSFLSIGLFIFVERLFHKTSLIQIEEN
jgi:sodium/proline symporter